MTEGSPKYFLFFYESLSLSVVTDARAALFPVVHCPFLSRKVFYLPFPVLKLKLINRNLLSLVCERIPLHLGNCSILSSRAGLSSPVFFFFSPASSPNLRSFLRASFPFSPPFPPHPFRAPFPPVLRFFSEDLLLSNFRCSLCSSLDLTFRRGILKNL